jgi:hypothetical protein
MLSSRWRARRTLPCRVGHDLGKRETNRMERRRQNGLMLSENYAVEVGQASKQPVATAEVRH